MNEDIRAAVLEIAKGLVEGLEKAHESEKGVAVYISPAEKLLLIGILKDFIQREDGERRPIING